MSTHLQKLQKMEQNKHATHNVTNNNELLLCNFAGVTDTFLLKTNIRKDQKKQTEIIWIKRKTANQ